MSAVTVAGLAANLYHIAHQSVWYDEAFSILVAGKPFGELTRDLIKDFVQPPLHYYLLHLVFQTFGSGALQARLVSAVFGTLAVTMTYLLARNLFDVPTAAIAAVLLAFSQRNVMYSQEARPYAQLLFFVLLSAYLFIRAVRSGSAMAWWMCLCTIVLTLHTHYYGAFAVGVLFAWAAIYGRRHKLSRLQLFGGAVVVLVSLLPWLASGIIRQLIQSPKTMPAEQAPWFAIHWFTLASALNDFNNGKPHGVFAGSPLWTYAVGGILFTLPAALAIYRTVRTKSSTEEESLFRKNVWLLTGLWLIPMLLVIALGMLNVQYDVRYLAFAAAPYYILVARGIVSMHRLRWRWIWVCFMLAYSIYSLRAIYSVPYKENYRDSLAYLADHYQPQDCAVFLPSGPPLQWFVYPHNGTNLRLMNLQEVATLQPQCHRVWLVTYRRTDQAAKIGDQAKHVLDANHVKAEERSYFWVDVGLYLPREQ